MCLCVYGSIMITSLFVATQFLTTTLLVSFFFPPYLLGITLWIHFELRCNFAVFLYPDKATDYSRKMFYDSWPGCSNFLFSHKPVYLFICLWFEQDNESVCHNTIFDNNFVGFFLFSALTSMYYIMDAF